ncbi:MAG: DUF5348 domain-containing protein [Treponema sp.]|nr:DUF5348 domain-containing protein [Treponema sp.]
MAHEKIEGALTFDINSGKFWVTDPEDTSPRTSIEFGDTFEVKIEDKWVETGIEITSDESGNLLFKLKNTNYAGILDGLEVRI